MLRCAWLPVAITHHVRHRLRHGGHAVRRLRHHHRVAYRWVCFVVGAAGVGGTGLAAGWGIGGGIGSWWPSMTAWGAPASPAWSPGVLPVPEPNSLMLLAIPLAIAFVIAWRRG